MPCDGAEHCIAGAAKLINICRRGDQLAINFSVLMQIKQHMSASR
jgi:hypothetical protein